MMIAMGPFSIGGSISGLTAAGLKLLNNGGDELPVPSGAMSFAFATKLPTGASYNVTISGTPSSLVCTVTNGSGMVGTTNVTRVHVDCLPRHSIVANISGLTENGLTLHYGSMDIPVPAGTTSVGIDPNAAEGQMYSVTLGTTPTALSCMVMNGSGMVLTDVTVEVSCVPRTYAIKGTVSGLTASGLTLQNNSEVLGVPSGAMSFEFPTPVAHRGSYNVTVASSPVGLRCSVMNGMGMVNAAEPMGIAVSCMIAPPSVVATTPMEGSVEFPWRAPVVVTFDRSMDTSMTLTTATVNNGAVALAGVWSNGNKTISFNNPPVLQANAQYSIDLTGFRDAGGTRMDPVPVVGDGRLDFRTIPHTSEPIVDLNSLGTSQNGTLTAVFTPASEPTNDTDGSCDFGGTGGDVMFRYTVQAPADGVSVMFSGGLMMDGLQAYAYQRGGSMELGCVNASSGDLVVNQCVPAGTVLYVVVDASATTVMWGNRPLTLAVTEQRPNPALVVLAPSMGSTNVPPFANLHVDFGYAAQHVGTLTVTGSSSGTRTFDLAAPMGAAVTWSADNRGVTIDPAADFMLGETVIVSLAGARFATCLTPGIPAQQVSFSVRSTAPVTGVTTLSVSGLPMGTRPAWGLGVRPGEFVFGVGNHTGLAAGTVRGGVVSAPRMGGAATVLFAPNQGLDLDPQVVFTQGNRTFAFNGLFSMSLGVEGLYEITGPSTFVRHSAATQPLGVNNGNIYGWSSANGVFYAAQYLPAPYEILGASVDAADTTPMTRVSNATGNSFSSGPFGVAVSSTRIYAVESSDLMFVGNLAMVPAGSVPTTNPYPVTWTELTGLAGPSCDFDDRMLMVLDSVGAPTRMWFTSWEATAAGDSTHAQNRICELAIDASGMPVGPAQVIAGSASGAAAAGDADSTGNGWNASFRAISGMAYDATDRALYVLQQQNNANAQGVIRRVQMP